MGMLVVGRRGIIEREGAVDHRHDDALPLQVEQRIEPATQAWDRVPHLADMHPEDAGVLVHQRDGHELPPREL